MNLLTDVSDLSMLAIFIFYTTFGMTMILLLVGSRFSRAKTLVIVYGSCFLLLVWLFVLARFFGSENLLYLYTPCLHLPALALSMYLSPERGWKTVFQFLSAVALCFLIQQVGAVFMLVSGGKLWAMWLGYLFASAVELWLVLRYLRPLSLRELPIMRHGWWLICSLLAGHYLMMIYLLPGISGLSNARITAIKVATCLMMVGIYLVFLTLVSSLSREVEARHNAELTMLQLRGLEQRMEAVRQAEETVRMDRHDMRHRLRTIAELIRQGQTQEALAYTRGAEERLEGQRIVHWCRSPVLDAVFSSCFSQAEQQGVRVDAEIRLSEQLSVDEAELALVFANALENAINACMLLPKEARAISCLVIAHPQLMFQIANPIDKPVSFGEDGLPLAAREKMASEIRQARWATALAAAPSAPSAKNTAPSVSMSSGTGSLCCVSSVNRS